MLSCLLKDNEPDALRPLLLAGFIALLVAFLPFLLPPLALIMLCAKTVAVLNESEAAS